MDFITESLGRFIAISGLGLAVCFAVWKQYAERHPMDAKRRQVQAGRAIGGWLKKRLK